MPVQQLLRPFPVIALFGPTAVGKTEVAIRLAQELGAEIINVDSVQLYRHLDIGSAKPTPEERRMAPHHLVDIRDPDQPMDAALFASLAHRAMAVIQRRGRPVILAGGTGLYLDAIVTGMDDAPPASPAIRAYIKGLMERFGTKWLHRQLRAMDPEAAGRIHPNDRFRITRALEVLMETGRPISWWWRQGTRSSPLTVAKIGLTRPREELYARVEKRVDKMLEMGLIQEVERLLAMGYSPSLRPLQTLGYRHIILFLQGRWSLEEAVGFLKRDTRRFAKRQLTWFRAYRDALWVHPGRLLDADSIWKEIHQSPGAID